jgi:hypothetical protein
MNTRFALALGEAVIQSWGELPQNVQVLLFEGAVVAGHRSMKDEMLREQLAAYLHDNHPKTHDAEATRSTVRGQD